MKKGTISLLIAGMILLGIGISVAVFAFGFGGFMGGFFGGNVMTISASQVSALSTVSVATKTIKIDKSVNTIYFYAKDVTIPVIASPKGGPMYSFGIYGLINPRVVVQRNAKVTIEFVNGDNDMYHGIVITSGAPPYYYMGAMMFDGIAFVGSEIRPLPPENNGKFYMASNTFIANNAGDFYYICQVPGHAADGMYGEFVVR